MSNLLIEIGTEELPANQIKKAISHIRGSFEKILNESGLTFSSIKEYATPRRLGLFITDVSDQGPDTEKELKGPPKKICFDKDGNPSKALEGFLNKSGITIDDVSYKMFGKNENAVANIIVPGVKLADVVSEELPKIILSFPHPHSMKWDETGVSWVRPIRWIVALKDSEVLPVKLGKVVSGRFTKSPRPEKTCEIEIKSANDYEKTLESMGVIPGYQERKDFIFNKANGQAKELGLVIKRNEKLLNELVGIVERPFVVTGEFPVEYIESTPDLVLRSVLVSDLRFIPFEKPDGTLSNRFALTINGGENLVKTTMAGEMKVLLGKLSDAKFFFEKDRQKKLEDYRDSLSGIAFIKGLGTIQDKTERLVKIASDLSKFSDENIVDLVKSASLSKLDLATSLVREHDELQGEIGGLYASLDGENGEISKAISQHYLPATEVDILPETKTGLMLSLIDKTDSLVNLISAGSIPKGSADPLGVRRFATNIIRILVDGEIDENFEELINVCLGYSIKKSETAFEDIVAFIKPRLEKLLKDKGHRYDVVRASISDNISNIKDAERKCIAITAIYQKDEFVRIVETAKRLKNILKDWDKIEFDNELFENGTEKEFAASAKSIFERIDVADSFENKFDILFELVAPADKYFEEILVNAEDEKIRNNRKNFLSWVLLGMFKISDFTAIAI